MNHRYLLPQPLNRLLVACFVLVAVVPVVIVSVWLYQAAWANAWREINEKHRLLAQNLAAPLSIYVEDHRHMLGMLADDIHRLPADRSEGAQVETKLRNSLSRLTGFRSLTLVDIDGRTRVLLAADGAQPLRDDIFAEERCFNRVRSQRRWSLSGIKRSPIDGRPTLIMGHPVSDEHGNAIGVLLGELRVSLIDKLRRQIKFGERGHSAIVDQFGHVIAHPNPAWMSEMRDISSWPIVREMLAGHTGVLEFYSPFIGQTMVAGYAAVPGIGWGVMVPQPKSEAGRQVAALMTSQLVWSAVGLTLALMLAWALSRWIRRPINQLVEASERLMANDFHGELPTFVDYAPREMAQLGQVLRRLVSGLQGSRDKVSELNASLQRRVDEATAQLRDANARLEKMAGSDHLTSLANRRHFEQSLSELLNRRRTDVPTVCIMLIDIDNFKHINDRYGHAAGDALLMQVARVLEDAMRHDDLVARYGGDEFVAQLRCPRHIARQRAWDIHERIKNNGVAWNNEIIHITASIGLLCHDLKVPLDVEQLLHRADTAMYQAKRTGRDTVVELDAN